VIVMLGKAHTTPANDSNSNNIPAAGGNATPLITATTNTDKIMLPPDLMVNNTVLIITHFGGKLRYFK
jgi:hypothetical protein